MPPVDSEPPFPAATSSFVGAQLPAAEPEQPLIGDRYRVIEELGRGGMGVVYRVEDAGSNQLALKQLLVSGAGANQSQSISLFEREYHVLSQLAHPRVIAVYDYGVDASGPYYTMELLDGGDLKALAPLPVEQTCRLLVEVCSSVALLHARRLVHRDITPRNVRCTQDGHAKLIDFGAMVPMGPCAQVVGTPAFIAPEVVNHSTLDARTDLFSLGATLYYTLTGRPPFAVGRLSDLREAWSTELIPPSHFVAAIPPALDALCVSLLRIDPAQRPRTAFEVIQRLQAIAGISVDEPEDVKHAYLTTPVLVGRAETLRGFRTSMRRALHGQGSTLLFESEPGLGRTRMLDACVTEAKTLGAIVLRAAARTSAHTAFAIIQTCLEQLLEAVPEIAKAAADAAGVAGVLLDLQSPVLRLRSLADTSLEHATLQQAISAFIVRVTQSHALMIAIDDVPYADASSMGLLATLSLEAPERRLLLCATTSTGLDEETPRAFRVLCEHAATHTLNALTREETETLLASVFDDVPNLRLLAERLFQVALGNPRETLDLARHLVSTSKLRYENGQWTLPGTFDTDDLPATAAEALATRVAALPELARRLAEAQALVGNAWRRQDYARLAPDAAASAVDEALSTLLVQEILQSDGEHYSLTHRGISEALCALLSQAQRRERHLALFELYRHAPDMHPYLIVHHLFEAERPERALELLAQYESMGEQKDSEAALRAGPARVARTLEHALELAISLGRPPREEHELRRRLCALAMIDDQVRGEWVLPAWLVQLEHDSGLRDYRALDPALESGTRLQQALTAAAARFAASPESARVYRVDEAIKHLVVYVLSEIVRTWRSRDPEGVRSLAELLEPFVSLSPALLALWHNARAARAIVEGHALESRSRFCDVWERMALVPTDALRFVTGIRMGAARMIARQDASMGRSSALEWAKHLDAEPLHRIDAMSLRRLLCMMLGDRRGADYFGRQAELLSLRYNARQPFDPEWVLELAAYELVNDLAGARRVIEAITPLALRYPGWEIQLQIAKATYDLMRGDLEAAAIAFCHAEARTRPVDPTVCVWVEQWISAVVGSMSVSLEKKDFTAAVTLGESALATCKLRGFDYGWLRIAETLALAEAKADQRERAIARLENVIDSYRQLEVHGLLLANAYATRARIANWAGEAGTAFRFATLASAQPGGESLRSIMTNTDPQSFASSSNDGAVGFGASAAFGIPDSASESVLGSRLREEVLCCPNKQSRTAFALEHLCALTGGDHGQLYLVDSDQHLTLSAASPGAEPDANALMFARAFFKQQNDEEDFDTQLVHATQMLSLPGAAAYVDQAGQRSHLYMLACNDNGTLVRVGLAVLRVNNPADDQRQLVAELAVLALCFLRTGDSPGIRAGHGSAPLKFAPG
jgi:hypothetical protein